MSIPKTEEECREYVMSVRSTRPVGVKSSIRRAAEHAAKARGFKTTKEYIESLIVKDLGGFVEVFNAIHYGKVEKK